MLTIGFLLLSLSGGPYVHPSTATGCVFDTGASMTEQLVLAAAGLSTEPRMTRRCRRIREIQIWVAALRPAPSIVR